MSSRVALYARVSTTDQHAEAQLDVLREHARSRGWEVVEEFVDRGVSGARDRRPALDRLMRRARRRLVDVVACVKLDRLARSVRHLTDMAAEFEALGIGLVVLDQSIDTSTPAGRLLFHVLGSIAEFERDLIRERTVAGLRAARRRGAKLGRPRAVDKAMEARIRRLRASGRSVREVSRITEIPRSVVSRVDKEGGG